MVYLLLHWVCFLQDHQFYAALSMVSFGIYVPLASMIAPMLGETDPVENEAAGISLPAKFLNFEFCRFILYSYRRCFSKKASSPR